LALENIAMTFNALEYCRAHDLPLVYASSREVYGNIPGDITEESCADFNQAASPCSASKLSGEALVYSYARCYGLRYIVFRFSNVYGRYDNDLKRMERVIPLFIRDISQGRPVTVFGPEKLLDFTYVDDCVSGITAGVDLLTSGAAVNETINLAYGRGHTLLELTDYIGDAVGVTPRVTLRRSLTGEVTRYVADIGKARALLGYAPQVPLQEGVRRAVAWGYGRTDEADSTVARRDDPIPQGA
jgi:UDP-glucose 4-epimerase